MGWNDIPELRGLPPREQRRIWRRASWRALRYPAVWGSLAGALIIGLLGDHYGGSIFGGLCMGAAGAIGMGIWMDYARPHIREILHNR
jgi:hypothetical protein